MRSHKRGNRARRIRKHSAKDPGFMHPCKVCPKVGEELFVSFHACVFSYHIRTVALQQQHCVTDTSANVDHCDRCLGITIALVN